MAKEFILVPKMKYENLVRKVSAINESDISNDQDGLTTQGTHEGRDELQHPVKNENVSDRACSESTTNSDFDLKEHKGKKKSQTGHGMIVKTKGIGRPPGKSTKQRKKIKWLIY